MSGLERIVRINDVDVEYIKNPHGLVFASAQKQETLKLIFTEFRTENVKTVILEPEIMPNDLWEDVEIKGKKYKVLHKPW